MSTQREAIELALDALIRVNHDLTRQEKRKAINTCIQALAELGDPENIEQEAMQQVQAVIQAYTNGWNAALGQHKPLSDERIDQIIASNVTITDRNLHGAVYMAIREVEAEHGIQE